MVQAGGTLWSLQFLLMRLSRVCCNHSLRSDQQSNLFSSWGTRVMLDSALAKLSGVTTKNRNQAVKRNRSRFPPDFFVPLGVEDSKILRFQSRTSTSTVHGRRRCLPFAFTEHGVAMLSSVLRSEQQAVQRQHCDSFHSGPCSPLTNICAASSSKWKRLTTRNSKPFLPPSARCWRHQFLPSGRSDSMPGSVRFGAPPQPRKPPQIQQNRQVNYPQHDFCSLRKCPISSRIKVLSIRSFPPDRHVRQVTG